MFARYVEEARKNIMVLKTNWRITGYLVGTLDRFNDGEKVESDRKTRNQGMNNN